MKTEPDPAATTTAATNPPAASPEAPAAVSSAPAPEVPERKFSIYQHIVPSHLAMVASMKAVNGFVVITDIHGKEEVWPDLRVQAMAADCLQMLAKMDQVSIRTGKDVPKHIRLQVAELLEKAGRAAAAARHQRDTLGRHDTEGKAVNRMLTAVERQKGLRPDLGEYSEDHLPEELNIRHYLNRFPYLKDFEISGILRNSDVPWDERMRAMSLMNGMRASEELGLTVQEAAKAMSTGELPKRLQNGRPGSGKPSPSRRTP